MTVTQPPTAAGRVPAELTSPRSKLVYLFLRAHGSASAADLAEHLDMPRLTLYGVLGSLEEQGLVSERNGCYVPSGD